MARFNQAMSSMPPSGFHSCATGSRYMMAKHTMTYRDRCAAWCSSLHLTRVPWAPRLDVRFEATMKDPSVPSSQGVKFMYWEDIEKRGYTNRGQIFSDWIEREDKVARLGLPTT